MPTTIKSTGYLTLSEALESVAAVLNVQKYEAQKFLRELLYSGQVPSQIIENSGQPYDTPKYVWGGIQWGEALKSGGVHFEVAAYAPDTHGRVIIPERHLIEALNAVRRWLRETGRPVPDWLKVHREDEQPKAPAEGHRRPGRPTLAPEIEEAYRDLKDKGQVNFSAPKTELYPEIRKRICNRDDLTITVDVKGRPRGLGNEAMRLVVTPLWEADLAEARRLHTEEPSRGPQKL